MGLALFFRPPQTRIVILGVLMFLFGLAHLFIYLIYTKLVYHFTWILPMHLPIIVLLGPTTYFYISFIAQTRQNLEIRDGIHLVLPVIYFGISLLFNMNNGPFKDIYLKEIIEKGEHSYFRYFAVIGVVVIIVYLLLSGLVIAGRVINSNRAFWKILALLLFSWMIAAVSALIGVMTMSIQIIRINSYLLGIIILLLYILSQRYPYLMLFGTLSEKDDREKDSTDSNRRNKSQLSSVSINSIKIKLDNLMQQEGFYRDETLSLKSLADAVEITSHQLSELINAEYGKNFNQYVNSFRIEEAKRLLLENEQKNALAIAYDAGFNSYSAFHASFKKETGFSPAEFRKASGKTRLPDL